MRDLVRNWQISFSFLGSLSCSFTYSCPFFHYCCIQCPGRRRYYWLGVLIGCACSASVFVCTVCDKDMIQSIPAEHFDVMRSRMLFPSIVNGLNVAADRCMFQSITLIPCKWKKNSILQLVQDSWRCRRLQWNPSIYTFHWKNHQSACNTCISFTLAPLASLTFNPSILCSGAPVSIQDRDCVLQYPSRHDNAEIYVGTGGLSQTCTAGVRACSVGSG